MTDGFLTELLSITETLLPGVSVAGATLAEGQYHDVVLLPGRAAVRIARRPAAAEALERRTELMRRLTTVGLPFQIPEPLSDVTVVNDRTAVAISWIDGEEHGEGQGDADQFAKLLAALADVDCKPLLDVLGRPHEFAGGPQWAQILYNEAIPLLPKEWQPEARRRIDAALELPDVEPTLVHGDLAGGNLRWSTSGHLIGVLDWDLASPFDSAYDAACLGWHSWEALSRAVPTELYQRAVVWNRTFGIEQVSAALLNGEPPEMLELFVRQTVDFLEQTTTA